MGVHLRCRSLQPRLLTKAFGGDRLMVRRPALNAFAGRWRIVAMDVWSNDVLDLVEKAHISFEGTSGGEIAFVAVKGFLCMRRGRSGKSLQIVGAPPILSLIRQARS